MSPHIGPDLSLNVYGLVLALGIMIDNAIECKAILCSIVFCLHHRECCGFATWLRYHERYLTACGLSRVACGTTYFDFYREENHLSKPAVKFIVLIHGGIQALFCFYAKELRCQFNSQ